MIKRRVATERFRSPDVLSTMRLPTPDCTRGGSLLKGGETQLCPPIGVASTCREKVAKRETKGRYKQNSRFRINALKRCQCGRPKHTRLNANKASGKRVSHTFTRTRATNKLDGKGSSDKAERNQHDGLRSPKLRVTGAIEYVWSKLSS